MAELSTPRWVETIRTSIVVILFVACFLWGGGSRLDIPGLMLLQPLAVLCLGGLLLTPGSIEWDVIRTPLCLLGALASVMIVQLFPLPPAIWTALPGQDQVLPFLSLAGPDLAWRSLSLTPDLTLAALVGLVVPLATLIGFAALPRERSNFLLFCLIIALSVSALFGLAQLLGGNNSPFYRYSVTNEGAAVGLFSNRNHQAAFLAMGWPMLAVWATGHSRDLQRHRARNWIALALALFLVPMVAATGSRAGLFLAAIGLGFGWWIWASSLRRLSPDQDKWGMALKLAPLAAGTLLLASAILLSRAEAVSRLFTSEASADRRDEALPVLINMARDFAPFGSGFGSFDPLFRIYEPDNLLRPTYLNHAHNDVIELAITGGMPALLIAAIFLLWMLRKAVGIIRGPGGVHDNRFGTMAASAMLIVLASSVVDYPLRTPLHAMLFALFCGWLSRAAVVRSHPS